MTVSSVQNSEPRQLSRRTETAHVEARTQQNRENNKTVQNENQKPPSEPKDRAEVSAAARQLDQQQRASRELSS
ncbi:MAG: hypothetical protein K2X66_16525 [Cyanobacteria bacterium]|nr:hypothetical protein [Cyanobacteriota bacterium]